MQLRIEFFRFCFASIFKLLMNSPSPFNLINEDGESIIHIFVCDFSGYIEASILNIALVNKLG